ncbi:hypothetical protein [Nonomuraea sp. NPDC049129]
MGPAAPTPGAVAGRFPTESRATALGWTAGMGCFGAVFGPWLGF